MTTVVIPFVFAGDGGQQVPVSQIDTDFQTLADAINAFNPGGGAGGPGTVWGVRGLVGSPTSTTVYAITADAIVFRNPTDGSVAVKVSPGALSNDITLAGPIINGRDMAGVFSASSWIHLYAILNPTSGVVSTLSSATAPPTGPALPSGDTMWAYAGALRLDGSTLITPTLMRGALMSLNPLIQVVVNGSPAIATETPVDVSATVPPNALTFLLSHAETYINGVTTSTFIEIRLATGVSFNILQGGVLGTGVGDLSAQIVVPNVGQQYLYLWNLGASSAPIFDSQQYINGYRVANGDA